MERVACETKTVQGRYSTLLSRGEANSASSSRVVEMFMLSKVANALVVMWTFIGNILVYFLKFSQKKMKSVTQYQAVRYYTIPLCPCNERRLAVVERKIMVLDLDETLIHSHHNGPLVPSTVVSNILADFVLNVEIDHCPVQFNVFKRPHVDYFLDMVSEWYDLVVFTASLEVYGSAVVKKLERKRRMFKRCFYRQHCKMDLLGYTKDLTIVSRNLGQVFILDNSPGAYRGNPENAIPIKSWFADPHDTALLSLLPLLDALRFTNDVRTVLRRNLHLNS